MSDGDDRKYWYQVTFADGGSSKDFESEHDAIKSAEETHPDKRFIIERSWREIMIPREGLYQIVRDIYYQYRSWE